MFLTFVFSVLLSLIIVFEELFFSNQSFNNPNVLFNEEFFFHEYRWDYTYDNYADYNENESLKRKAKQFVDNKLNNQLPYIFSFTIIHDFFSYFLFCFLITLVDLMTLSKLKQALTEKSRLVTSNIDKKG
jgi:hypothetical protein